MKTSTQNMQCGGEKSRKTRPKSRSLQPCTCEVPGCGKRFSKQSNLRAHLRVHNGTLPYSCVFVGCSKRFRWKSSLRPHIRVHLACGHVLPFGTASPWAVKIAKKELENLDSKRLKRSLRLAVAKMDNHFLTDTEYQNVSSNPACPKPIPENCSSLERSYPGNPFSDRLVSEKYDSTNLSVIEDLESGINSAQPFEVSYQIAKVPGHSIISNYKKNYSTPQSAFHSQSHPRVKRDEELLILEDFSGDDVPVQHPFTDTANELIENIDDYCSTLGSTPILYCHRDSIDESWFLPGTLQYFE